MVIPTSVIGMGSNLFYGISSLPNVYYYGSESEWASVDKIDDFDGVTVYYDGDGISRAIK